jgi:thymidylate synthase
MQKISNLVSKKEFVLMLYEDEVKSSLHSLHREFNTSKLIPKDVSLEYSPSGIRVWKKHVGYFQEVTEEAKDFPELSTLVRELVEEKISIMDEMTVEMNKTLKPYIASLQRLDFLLKKEE